MTNDLISFLVAATMLALGLSGALVGLYAAYCTVRSSFHAKRP